MPDEFISHQSSLQELEIYKNTIQEIKQTTNKIELFGLLEEKDTLYMAKILEKLNKNYLKRRNKTKQKNYGRLYYYKKRNLK